jgi:hypothetical protein
MGDNLRTEQLSFMGYYLRKVQDHTATNPLMDSNIWGYISDNLQGMVVTLPSQFRPHLITIDVGKMNR